MDKGFSRGHELYSFNGIDWFYTSTNEPQYEIESCTKCGLKASQDDPDPCLGMLPGVKYACCGHGIPGQDYVVLNNGNRISLEEYKQNNHE